MQPPFHNLSVLACAIKQVLGIHLGLKHLHRARGPYTPQLFKDAATAVHVEDQRWASQTALYMAAHCPQAWNAITTWK